MVLKHNEVWIVEKDGQPVAFLAMQNDFIAPPCVHPDHWQQETGNALLEFARRLAPDDLWL